MTEPAPPVRWGVFAYQGEVFLTVEGLSPKTPLIVTADGGRALAAALTDATDEAERQLAARAAAKTP